MGALSFNQFAKPHKPTPFLSWLLFKGEAALCAWTQPHSLGAQGGGVPPPWIARPRTEDGHRTECLRAMWEFPEGFWVVKP